MIKLSNGHQFEYMVASGALAYDGKGWPWERPLYWIGMICPEIFTVVTKTLTRQRKKGNLRWWNPLTWLPWSPWSCVRFLPNGGVINKVGLTNPGIEWWCNKFGPYVDRDKIPLVVSIYGTLEELVEMAKMLNRFDLVAIEINTSCPNTGHTLMRSSAATQEVVAAVKAVKAVSRHPIIIKLSVAQDYCAIVAGLEGIAEAVSPNSVPWEDLKPTPANKKPLQSPLRLLEKKVGGGGGGVSGRTAQRQNWQACFDLIRDAHAVPVIFPSIMSLEDVEHVRDQFGAEAVSFGAIHVRTPCQPTSIVRRLNEKELDYTFTERE